MSYKNLPREVRINLLLLIAILILSLIAWYQPGLKKVQVHLLSSLKKENIHHIVLEREFLASIKLSQVNNHWFMDAPYQLAANNLRVDTILALAEKRSYSQFQVSHTDLKTYQLDKPSVSVWLNHQPFILGSNDPIKKQRYAINVKENTGSDQHTVHLINGLIYYQLRAALNSFISLSLLPPEVKIKSIHWANKTLTIDNNQWQLSPKDAQVSSDSIIQLLQYWQKIQASKVETDISFDIEKKELLTSKSIIINYMQTTNNGEQQLKTITYAIIQEGSQLKLFRADFNIAYWLSPQQLRYITEFMPVKTL